MNEKINTNTSFNKVAVIISLIASIMIILEAGYKTGQWLFAFIN